MYVVIEAVTLNLKIVLCYLNDKHFYSVRVIRSLNFKFALVTFVIYEAFYLLLYESYIMLDKVFKN